MDLLIIGAGGHGRCCFEIAQRMKCFKKIDFIDDNINYCLGKKVIGKMDSLSCLKSEYDSVFIAVGNNELRKDITSKVKKMGFQLILLIDPSAVVSSYSKIGLGCVIFPNAVIEADSEINEGCIISTNSSIHHDTLIGEYALIYSQCVIKPYAKVNALEVIQSSVVVGGK